MRGVIIANILQAALLVGSSPRAAGMERADLLRKNAEIFVHQGKVGLWILVCGISLYFFLVTIKNRASFLYESFPKFSI
mgnify:CR=1 FL=1